MPYRRNSDLPDAVKNALPAEAQSVFRSAFNSAIEDVSEERAFRIAWGAVRRGWRPPQGSETKWQRKANDSAQLEPMNVTNDGVFQGYVAFYDVEPVGFDFTFRAGCFDRTMEERRPEDIRMLWQHDQERPIGRWFEWRSDPRGLWMRGQLALDAEAGREVKALMAAGAVEGLSIGFEAVEMDGKEVTVADLFEVSVVTFPAMEEAQVDSVQMFDKVPIGDVRRTASGYLTTVAKVSRTGIQVYLGREVGRPDLKQVRVYRPPSEVFDEESMYSIAHQPVTLDHPPEAVSAKNWKKYAVGQIGGEIDGRDGKFIQVPLVLMDEAAIKAVEDGRRELSMGYSAQLKWGEGKTEDGMVYDAIQTHIRANHLAVVPEARGGSKLRIGDTIRREGERRMSDAVKLATILIDGQSVEVADIAARTIMNKLAALEEELRTLRGKLNSEQEKSKKAEDAQSVDAKALADVKVAIATKDAELATLRKLVEDGKVTPQKLDQMVRDRATVISKAKAVLGQQLTVDGKTDAEIRRQVVDAHLGADAKDYSDEQVSACFAIVTKDVKMDQHAIDPLASQISDRMQQHQLSGGDPREAAFSDGVKQLTERWRKPGQVGGRPGPVRQ